MSKMLEFAERACLMGTRLIRAAERMSLANGPAVADSRHVLRREQMGVFLDFAAFLRHAADPAKRQERAPTGRIVLPPRTGKTVIAGQIIAASGMMTVFIVPTKTLVEQTVRALHEQLPDIPVGTYYGDGKNLVMWGVNVTTYKMLQNEFRSRGHLPPELMHASLIFIDEGHRSMTAERQEMLTNAFEAQAVRVALTATPNYNARRRLAAFYTYLIHEISISEAIELEMVSPVRVWIAAVDIDGSKITMKAGDYDERRLGKLMRAAPFFEAARSFRYDASQEEKGALVCCVSQSQAITLHAYWCKHLPKGKPAPGLILGTTSKTVRESLLAQFEAGEIDTLINVGVLIEGWSSLRCKLVIDLAPSCSWVRATQKFFRPMTRWEDREAGIFMLVPRHLPVQPVIPMDLFEWNAPAFEQGMLIASQEWIAKSDKRVARWPGLDHLKKVITRTDIIFDVKFEKPKLDITNDKQIMRVLMSCPQLLKEGLPNYTRFRRLVFRHPLFSGRGENLLRFCGVPASGQEYLFFMTRFFPERVSELYCESGRYNETGGRIDDPFIEQRCVSLDAMDEAEDSDLADRLPQLQAKPAFVEEVDEAIWRQQLRQAIIKLLKTLPKREAELVMKRFGLESEAYGSEPTFAELGALFGITHTRVQQVLSNAIWKLKDPVRQGRLISFHDPFRPRGEVVRRINREFYAIVYVRFSHLAAAVTLEKRANTWPLVCVNENHFAYREAKQRGAADFFVADEIWHLEATLRRQQSNSD